MKPLSLLVLASVVSFSLIQPAVASAEGPVLASAKRAAAQIDAQPAAPPARSAAPAAQGAPSSARSNMKVALALGAAVAFAASVWAIDGKVENNTPSSLGLRKDY